MTKDFLWMMLRAVTFAVIFSGTGCVSRGTPLPEKFPQNQNSPETQPAFHLEDAIHERVATVEGGKQDKRNKYRSTVQILIHERLGIASDESAEQAGEPATEEDREQETYHECSGVLVAPDAVLTAAHCVCKERKAKAHESSNGQVQTLVDSSTCARDLTIRMVTYAVPPETRDISIPYRAKRVAPHPEFRISYNISSDNKKTVASSDADLAVVFLSKSVDGDFPANRLATSEIAEDDPVILVGYGPLEKEGTYGIRRFGDNTVAKRTAPKPSGLVQFYLSQAKAHLFEGDSGGGCFRETNGGLELVGIAGSRGKIRGSAQTVSIFTSTFSSIGWLRELGVIKPPLDSN